MKQFIWIFILFIVGRPAVANDLFSKMKLYNRVWHCSEKLTTFLDNNSYIMKIKRKMLGADKDDKVFDSIRRDLYECRQNYRDARRKNQNAHYQDSIFCKRNTRIENCTANALAQLNNLRPINEIEKHYLLSQFDVESRFVCACSMLSYATIVLEDFEGLCRGSVKNYALENLVQVRSRKEDLENYTMKEDKLEYYISDLSDNCTKIRNIINKRIESLESCIKLNPRFAQHLDFLRQFHCL